MIKKKTISEFLSDEYKEFAMYVIENRAIASVIDGFNPGQRKVIHVANNIWKTGNEKVLKVFQLSGKVASDSFYHHGDKSLSSTIINMAQKFKNNYPLLEEDGQFGSLRSTQAGAPRYVGTKLSNNFRLIYKDFNLLNYKIEEGEKIEPEYFLPIVPMILVNGSSGIAVGFSSNIMCRKITDVINATINYLSGKKIRTLKPSLNAFNGDYKQDKENHKRWIISGKFEKINTTTINITELPPSMTYEKYENILEKLVDDKFIVSYEDNCKDDVNYIIKMKRSELSKIDDEALIKKLKLVEYSTEIFTTLDENGKLKIFETVEEVLKYFVDFRLKFYSKRKSYFLNKMDKEYLALKNKAAFIKLILDGKIKVNNIAKSKIEKDIATNKLDKIDNSYDYLLRMPIYSLTKEVFLKLKNDIKLKNNEIKETKKLKPKDMYLEDLEELKKKVK